MLDTLNIIQKRTKITLYLPCQEEYVRAVPFCGFIALTSDPFLINISTALGSPGKIGMRKSIEFVSIKKKWQK